MKSVSINIDYLKVANYALFHNRIPVCQSLEITNMSEESIKDFKVVCDGEYMAHYETPQMARLGMGGSIRFDSFGVDPLASKLATLTERIMTRFTITVVSEETDIYKEDFEIELMPYDHWLGTTVFPQTIASFITPNHPSVNALVTQTAAMLKTLSGSSALSAYQTGNSNVVRVQVAAAFAAIHRLGIVYRSVPASYELLGQRITMPDQVIENKIGNCLELTLLMATVLEAIGINTVVVFQKGHAFLGAWLVDDCYPCSVCDDASFIEKSASRGIDEMLVLECTMVAQEKASFEDAVRAAEQELADHDVFEIFVDVKRCRLERILPLPARVQADGWASGSDGVEHDACIVDVKEHDRYDLSKVVSQNKELTKFDIWERKLLDFSLRNSLLNLSLRRRAIQFISFDIDRIEDHLQDGEEFCILAKPNVELSIDTSERLVRSKMYPKLRELVSSDIEHHYLHTYQTEVETSCLLTNIYRAARNSVEETGANSLFLTIGTLRWFETPQSETARYAPLLLLPVEMVYKRGKFYIRTRDEGISLNITLMEFLRQNHDIRIDGLNPLPEDGSGVNVPLIFAIIRDALKGKKGWDVEEECLLGTFSFSKFLMWNDIHTHREELKKNKIINSLVANRLTWTPEAIASNLKAIDRRMSPADIALPVPVDSSQLAAVIAGGKGQSFILYGPPGTGKSQTITNLIANALYQGKRVLFVAEKMAALSVVQRRLEKIGLGPFCLELHSNKVTKSHVLQQLGNALAVRHIIASKDFDEKADRLLQERKALIAYMDALHDIDAKDGLSLYDCILRYESIDGEPLDTFQYVPLVDGLLSKEGNKAIEELLGGRLVTMLKLVGQPSQHPLKGLHIDGSMLTDNGLSARMLEESGFINACREKSEELKNARDLRKRLLCDCKKSLLEKDAGQLRDQWDEVLSKWFIPRFFAKRRFIKQIRKYNRPITEEVVEEVIDILAEYQDAHGRLSHLAQLLKRYFGMDVPEDELPALSVLESHAGKLKLWSQHTDRMRDWQHWTDFCNELESKGLKCVADAMLTEVHDPQSICHAYLKALYRYKVDTKIRGSEVLAIFEGLLFDEKIATYKRMASEFRKLTQRELYARLATKVPQEAGYLYNSNSEVSILNRNVSNGGRGVSLRDLFDKLPTLLPRLCPCMLMSPMSVAQFLDFDKTKFDLVVFDEASQMPTSEAVGAIARGESLIVVGDPKQMPPTSFFSSTNVDEEEACMDDMESILEDCRTLGMPSLQLSWHYRSRHESLIAFSNNEYYEGSLITFPSADDRQVKVHHVPVSGFYDKGGKRCNKAEAEAIVKEIRRRLNDEELRRKSIGVIAFNITQQGLIEDMLQSLLDRDKALQDAADQMYEPIFIKNLENVQGDERDVILFSIGYGPNKEGKVSMNFGPLNNAGGERRLNVAVTRAREEMYVFSTLKSSDIDLRRSKALGVKGLKHFLEYAETQSLPTTSLMKTQYPDTVVAQQIAASLRRKGYSVATNIGRSRFKVDVAVEDASQPGTYRLGILLDGEGYRNTPTTRDREIVQPSVLTALNWQVIRVWSVDWFNNRDRVLERIEECLSQPVPQGVEDIETQSFDITKERLVEVIFVSKDYATYNTSFEKATNMADVDLMRNIISTEQPVTFTYLCRRMNNLREIGRVTPTIQRIVNQHLPSFYQDEYESIWLTADDSLHYKYYRPDSGRDIVDIPRIELINVLKETLMEQVALTKDDLIYLAARKLGYTRRGTIVDMALRDAIDVMSKKTMIEDADGSIRLVS